MHATRMRAAIAVAVMAGILSGCDTPRDVRDYARHTDLHITNLGREARSLTERETALVEARQLTARTSAEAAVMDTVTLQRAQERARQGETVCNARCVDTYAALVDLFETEEKAAAERDTAMKAEAKKLADALKPIQPTAKEANAALEAASKAAGTISEPMPKRKMVEFLIRYGKQVKTSYDDSMKAAEKASSTEKEAATATPTKKQ